MLVLQVRTFNLVIFIQESGYRNGKLQKDVLKVQSIFKAHFFESGNVQFNQKKNFKKDFQFQEDMAENSKSIIKLIERFENEVQTHLNDLYE